MAGRATGRPSQQSCRVEPNRQGKGDWWTGGGMDRTGPLRRTENRAGGRMLGTGRLRGARATSPLLQL